jgi:hypothetical protein
VRSRRGSTERIEKIPPSRSPYSAEKPPVVSSTPPTASASRIEIAPPLMSFRWYGSTSSSPSNDTYSSSGPKPRTAKPAAYSFAWIPGRRFTARKMSSPICGAAWICARVIVCGAAAAPSITP